MLSSLQYEKVLTSKSQELQFINLTPALSFNSWKLGIHGFPFSIVLSFKLKSQASILKYLLCHLMQNYVDYLHLYLCLMLFNNLH